MRPYTPIPILLCDQYNSAASRRYLTLQCYCWLRLCDRLNTTRQLRTDLTQYNKYGGSVLFTTSYWYLAFIVGENASGEEEGARVERVLRREGEGRVVVCKGGEEEGRCPWGRSGRGSRS